jgi:hypothetical protein
LRISGSIHFPTFTPRRFSRSPRATAWRNIFCSRAPTRERAYHPGLFRAIGLPPIPAAGKPFRFTQTHIIRIQEGLIAEIWEDFDRVRFWMQLGVTLVVPEG